MGIARPSGFPDARGDFEGREMYRGGDGREGNSAQGRRVWMKTREGGWEEEREKRTSLRRKMVRNS
jgi:hypothetical protein